MVNLLKRMVESLNTRKVRRTAARWLAVLVVFATTYSLVLPAITMSTTLKGELDGVEVKVEAGKGVLESGTELVLKNVLLPDDEVVTLSAESGEEQQDEDVRQLTQEELDKILEAAVDGNPDLVGKIIKVLDISLDHRGDEIEPNGLVKLHVSSDLIRDAQQPALVHLDDEGNATLIATKFNKDEGTLAEEADEEPDEDEDLPSVDSEGYLLDENGERVTDEDGNYTQYEVDEDGSLVLDEDGNPILVVPTEDEETEDKDGEESEKPEDGEESEDKDTEDTEDTEETESQKPEESEQPGESQKPEESEQPSESQKPEESEQPSESQKPEASEQPSVSQKPEASEQPSESQKPEEPSESQKPADPEPTPETPAAPEQNDPDPEPVPEEPSEPEQPAAPEVTVSDEDTALASAPASWGDDDPAATEDKTLVGMTDGFSIYAIVDVVEKTEEDEKAELPTVDSEGYVIDENGERVTDENGNYIRYQVDEDGNLVLDEDGNPILVKEITDPTMILLPEGAEIPEGYDKEYTCIAEDKTFAVVVYAPEGALPEGAELVAEVLPDESIETEDGGVVAMDIRFELDGEKVEPQTSVYVVINALGLLPETADPDSVSIQHHKDIDGETDAQTAVAVAAQVAGLVDESGIMTADEEPEAPADDPAPVELPENVEIVADSNEDTGIVETVSTTESATADVTAAFEVESFSSFTITYKKNGKSDSVTVYLMDESKNEIDKSNTSDLELSGYSGIESGVLISELVKDKGLDTFTSGMYKYTFDHAEVRSYRYNGSYNYTEVYRIKGKYKSGGILSSASADLQYSTQESGSSYSNFGSSSLCLIYKSEFTGVLPEGFVDDGLAYNNGTNKNGLYQQRYDGTKRVWFDDGVLGQYNYTDRHVTSVTMTPSDYLGNVLGTSVTVNRGNAHQATAERDDKTGKLLSDLFPGAKKAPNDSNDVITSAANIYMPVSTADEATYVKRDDKYYEKGSSGWNLYVNGTNDGFYRRCVSTDFYKYAVLQVQPDPGYYVTKVTVGCIHSGSNHPCECSRIESGTALSATFNLSTGVNPTLIVRSDAFVHQSKDGATPRGFYILIETAAIPSPLYVKYEAGTIGGQDATTIIGNTASEWLDNTPGRKTNTSSVSVQSATVDKLTKTGYKNGQQVWANGDLTYYAAGITEQAKAAARAKGYRFTGWKLEYYDEVKEDRNNIENTQFTVKSSSTDSNLKQPGESTELVINAKLIAQWEPIPVAEIVKNVTGQEGADQLTIKTYTFEVQTEDTSVSSFTVKRQRYVANGGITVPVDETITVPFVEGKGSFDVEIVGNRSYACSISGIPNGTYTVTETANGGAQRTTYSGHDLNVVIAAAGETQTTATVTVTNDFKPAPTTRTVRFVKIDGGNSAPLFDAHFALYESTDPKNPLIHGTDSTNTGKSISPDGYINWEKDNSVDLELEVDKNYVLVETQAPSGYVPMTSEISFSVDGDGNVRFNSGSGSENSAVSAAPTQDKDQNDATITLVTIKNNPGTILPSTGGPGLAHFTAFGVALMAAASLVLVLELLKRRGRARA